MQNCHEQIREFGSSVTLSLLICLFLYFSAFRLFFSMSDDISHEAIWIYVYVYISMYVAASRHGLTAFSRPHHPASLHLVTYILAFSLLLYYFYQFLLLSSAYLCSLTFCYFSFFSVSHSLIDLFSHFF